MSNNAKIVREYYKKNLTLFTDRIFREVATNKDFVEELLRDFIGQGKTVYHVERQIIETKSYLDNGYHEIYINAEVDDKSSIAEVMKVLSTTDYVNKNFKTITKLKEEKFMPVEVERAMEGLRQEGELKGELKTFVSLLRQGIISEEVVLKNLNISKEELEKRIKELAI